jgi:hypothetical protein
VGQQQQQQQTEQSGAEQVEHDAESLLLPRQRRVTAVCRWWCA